MVFSYLGERLSVGATNVFVEARLHSEDDAAA